VRYLVLGPWLVLALLVAAVGGWWWKRGGGAGRARPSPVPRKPAPVAPVVRVEPAPAPAPAVPSFAAPASPPSPSPSPSHWTAAPDLVGTMPPASPAPVRPDENASPARKVELARAYLDLGDESAARELLREAMEGRDPVAREIAARMLREID
jgi:pilus assembly protein FimV